MRAIVSLEQVYHRTPDGAIWTQEQFPASFFHRYLTVFDHVIVVARVADARAAHPDWRRLDEGPVSVLPLPAYHGPLQYAALAPKMRTLLSSTVPRDGAIILRVSSPIGTLLRSVLPDKRPHAVEVVSDPADVFGPHGIRHPLRRFLRWRLTRDLEKLCRTATAAAYVTEDTLQRRYPPDPAIASFGVSDVVLPKEAFSKEPRNGQAGTPFRMLLIGSLAQLYKGADLVIEATAALRRAGFPVEASILGDGRYRPFLEKLAERKQVKEYVRFEGRVPGGAAVREAIDRADLVVQPSRTEGLPRALIESMARGAPCVATMVGGIPELLSPADLVPVDDLPAFISAIQSFVVSSERRRVASARNLRRAEAFRDERLEHIRLSFLKAVEKAARNGGSNDRGKVWSDNPLLS